MKLYIKRKGKIEDIDQILERFRNRNNKKDCQFKDLGNYVISIPEHVSTEISEDGHGFLFDAKSGRVYALNTTASFIIAKIKEGLSLEDLAKQLTQEYEVSEGILVSDIHDLLYQLRELEIGIKQ